MIATTSRQKSGKVIELDRFLPILSEREKQVLKLIAYEYTTKEISQKLFVSPHTIDSHRKKLMEKWGVKNSAGLVRVGFQSGILK